MAIDYSKGRSDSFRALLVDPFDLNSVYGELEGLTGGTLNFNYYSQNKCGGSIDVFDAGRIGRYLIRVVDDMQQGGESEQVVLGTFFANADSISSEYGASVSSVGLESTLTKASGDCWAGKPKFDAGQDALALAEGILSDCGLSVVESGNMTAHALSSAVSYEDNSNKLTVANNLLSLCGLSSVGVDAYGNAVVSDYVKASDREPSWSFNQSNCMIQEPVTVNRPKVVNKVIASADIDGTTHTVTLTLDAASPYSFNNTGRNVCEVYQADVDTVDALANAAVRYFKAAVQASETVEISHHYAPIKVGDVVWLSQQGLNGLYLVRSIDMELSPGLPCKTVLSPVNDVEVENG